MELGFIFNYPVTKCKLASTMQFCLSMGSLMTSWCSGRQESDTESPCDRTGKHRFHFAAVAPNEAKSPEVRWWLVQEVRVLHRQCPNTALATGQWSSGHGNGKGPCRAAPPSESTTQNTHVWQLRGRRQFKGNNKRQGERRQNVHSFILRLFTCSIC